MSNILDYVRTYGGDSFRERRFCSADALVLAQLAYMNWQSAVPTLKDNGAHITLHETLYCGDLEHIIRGSVFKEENRALFYQTANSRRFGTLRLNYYSEVWNEERNLQMSAITFLFPEGGLCVGFRGTDESLNGWKESFSMVYRFPVPAQEYAATYLYRVARLTKGSMIVCGHSKGGNLAVYASVKGGEEIGRRIKRIYNFDGPGFWDDFFKEKNYDAIACKIRKYVAPESFIGLLLKDMGKTFMVECKARGMEQHDPYRWEVYNGRLRKVYRYKRERRKAGEQLNQRILRASKEKSRDVIDAFFKAATDSGLHKLSELNADYALEVLKNFHGKYVYDRESLIVFARLMIYMLPGRKILR